MKKGLTLIELIVTVAIITLLTGFSIPALNLARNRYQLRMTAFEIQSSILETKNYALAPRTAGTNINSYAIYFYGPTYIDSTKQGTYEIFERQGNTDVLVFGSTKNLPDPLQFEKFGDGANDRLIIRYSVESQGEIIEPATGSEIEIKIKNTRTSTEGVIKVIRATGAVNVTI